MRKRKGTTRILASILCFAMFICSIDISVMEVEASNNTTIIDITGLATGAETSHDCNKYLTSKYNTSQHWKECTVCGKIYNKEYHNIIDSGWTRGTPNDCNENNIHKFTCNCGYSYSDTIGKKQHNFSKVQNIGAYSAYETCYDCNQSTSRNYHKCKKADGSLIYGENLGTCAICGYNYTYVFHHAVESYYKAGEYVKCFNGEKLAYVNENKYQLNSVGNGTMITNITVPSNYKNINNGSYDQYTSDTNVNVSLNNVKVSGTNWTANQTITYTGHSENICRARIVFTATKEDNCNILLFMNKLIYPENEAPIISTITQQDITSSNGWATQKKSQ